LQNVLRTLIFLQKKKKNVKKEKIQALTKFFINKIDLMSCKSFGPARCTLGPGKAQPGLEQNIQRSYSIFFLLDASGGNN
jgi:hypothetical protein